MPRRAQRPLLRAASHLPHLVKRRIAGPVIERDDQTLDLDCQLLLRSQQLAAGRPLESYGVTRVRAVTARAALDGRSSTAGYAVWVPVRLEGARATLVARWYSPRLTPRTGAMLIYFHGGGFVTGGLETHDDIAQRLAHGSGACVLLVDYRLAPEHQFPAQLQDARATFAWARRMAPGLGCDPARIGVAGDSAGGNLAAALAAVPLADEPRPACQVLIYPWLDMSLQEPSVQNFATGFGLTRDELVWCRALWLGAAAEAPSAVSSPAQRDDLREAAPAYIVTAGFDPLRDEAERYAQRLQGAGVPVTLRRYPGLIHGFVEFLGLTRVGRTAVDELGDAVRRLLKVRAS